MRLFERHAFERLGAELRGYVADAHRLVAARLPKATRIALGLGAPAAGRHRTPATCAAAASPRVARQRRCQAVAD